ncbi:hypothetical protein FRX31_018205 [Thalictrum thalictroides]|uniref:RNase H type-1 domain-containing protein n=1 Tax=Thalictrum thalictroides TaxID=46969 RepID=A0A7J6W6W0_THATH|nr:hypothetical protein FRX31_018205 [Thalictrum thalictroides]
MSFTWAGPYPIVNVIDPDIKKEILSGKFDHCEKDVRIELNAVHQGLKLALFLNVRSLEVASDFLSVTRAINKLEKPLWDCEDQLKRIWDLASDFAQIRFYYVFRETNRAADFLAGMGTEQDSSILAGGNKKFGSMNPSMHGPSSNQTGDHNNAVHLALSSITFSLLHLAQL